MSHVFRKLTTMGRVVKICNYDKGIMYVVVAAPIEGDVMRVVEKIGDYEIETDYIDEDVVQELKDRMQQVYGRNTERINGNDQIRAQWNRVVLYTYDGYEIQWLLSIRESILLCEMLDEGETIGWLKGYE